MLSQLEQLLINRIFFDGVFQNSFGLYFLFSILTKGLVFFYSKN